MIKNASTIAMMYCMLFLCGGITISVYEGLPLSECLYEAASAVIDGNGFAGVPKISNPALQKADME